LHSVMVSAPVARGAVSPTVLKKIPSERRCSLTKSAETISAVVATTRIAPGGIWKRKLPQGTTKVAVLRVDADHARLVSATLSGTAGLATEATSVVSAMEKTTLALRQKLLLPVVMVAVVAEVAAVVVAPVVVVVAAAAAAVAVAVAVARGRQLPHEPGQLKTRSAATS